MTRTFLILGVMAEQNLGYDEALSVVDETTPPVSIYDEVPEDNNVNNSEDV